MVFSFWPSFIFIDSRYSVWYHVATKAVAIIIYDQHKALTHHLLDCSTFYFPVG